MPAATPPRPSDDSSGEVFLPRPSRPIPVVAIDGPSGSGKSTVSRALAQRYGLAYLDTGAMYRALTWWALEQGIDVTDADAVAKRCAEPVLVVGTDPRSPGIEVDGVDVSAPIRGDAVTGAVSAVSAVRQVRFRLVAEQRSIIDRGPIVVEGRDITTVVAPDAAVKIFLTADPAARAERRAAELAAGSTDTEVANTQRAMLARDAYDSHRTIAPLTQARDAVMIDATHLGVDEVVERIGALVLGAGIAQVAHAGGRRA